jgi:elongation factor G
MVVAPRAGGPRFGEVATMAEHSIHRVRNLALIGPSGAGKTTLAEQLLHAMGAIPAPGSIERGTTVCDHEPLEREYAHSLEVSHCSAQHAGHRISLLDTPGYPDFIGRTLAVLPAVETALLVLSAASPLERTAERLFRAARERGLDCFVIVNRIDAPGADCEALLGQLAQRLGRECLPLNLPAGGTQVRDCYFEPLPGATDFGDVEGAHAALVDQVVELDEALMQRYLEQGEALAPAQLHDAFERALREGHVVPVCFVSARTGAGIAELLRVIHELAPDPTEGNPPQFLKGEGEAARPVAVGHEAAAHVLAHVFRVVVDPYVGRLALVRVHQGTLSVGQPLLAGDARKPFKLSHLLRLQGRQQQEIPHAGPGEIVAISKIDELAYGTVIHDSHDEDHHHLRPVALPAPLTGLALEPAKHGDEQKLSDALHKLVAEDPSLRVEHRPGLNETVLLGLGALHLEVALRKMTSRGSLALSSRPPSVAYRETITLPAEGHARHKKQTGGAGQFGEVFLRIAPRSRDSGCSFHNEVTGGAIPGQFIGAVEKGVREVLSGGAIAGYPLQDVAVTVYDGKHHPVDSKEVAFVAAGRKAMLDAVDKAQPVLLEPVVNLRIGTAAGAVGDVTGDLSARRGVITGTDAGADGRVFVQAQLPIAELPAFQARLKSISAGDSDLAMEFSHYAVVPPAVQKELVGKYRRREED